MKFKIILTAFLLAAPCLNAGIDSWISSILPEKMRACESMRSSIYTATNHLKIKKPVFVMHESLEEKTLAQAENYLPFSIIKVDNDAIARQSDEIKRNTGYHEVGHVLHNHRAIDNTLAQISTPSYVLAMLTPFMYRYALTPLRRSALLATSAISLLGAIIAHNHVPDYKESTVRKHELQADAVAFSLTAALHGSAPLEDTLAFNEQVAAINGLDFRNRSEVHPTVGEEIVMIRATLDKNAV